jgi:hypothetical protein
MTADMLRFDGMDNPEEVGRYRNASFLSKLTSCQELPKASIITINCWDYRRG